MTHRLFAAVLFGLVPSSFAVAQTPRATPTTTDVPVTKVVLFSSGVGYFEHAGSVRGNSATELRFKTSQINDILKSIVLQDQDGGRVGAISYPSQDPLAKTLRSFQVDITQNPSLAQLLNQLRGARVSIQSQAEKLSGIILGVETRAKAGEKGETYSVAVLNLLTGATLRAVELPSINNLTLDDPQLQEELTRALGALVQARDQDKKPVTINFTGAGERHVRIGYVVETPVWKTSYRLLLDDKAKFGKLQAWAIVENQTESDWNGISLALVSGRPISFMMDLYQPLYSSRPTVVPELYASLRPQVYAGGIAVDSPRVAMKTAVSAPATLPRIGYDREGRPTASRLEEVVVTSAVLGSTISNLDAAASVQSVAAAERLGALFQYTVADVTLARQKSAMLPIITDSIELERLSIYNASVLRSNPLNGVLLKNTTGKHLLQGPLTVLDKGSYAGDARIDNVPPGQDRLLSYGIDLEMLVDNTKNTQRGAVLTAKIEKGEMIISRKLVSSQEYAANNKTGKDKVLVIEHPIRQGWHLVDTQKPFETTPSLYRFKGTAVANKVTVLTVKEEVVQDETIMLASANLDQLVYYSRTGEGGAEIPKSVRDALAKAIQLKQASVDVERDIAMRNQRVAEITAEQNRIRENMKTVAPATQYYDRLLAKLNEQESAIETLQKEREALIGRRDSLRRELDEYLSGLTVG
ncbi:MAG TPA: hypothetical protein VGQ56_03700 [Gemmatimonadaceae bacterium]|nr:hypothetical protein [Gemmatimonadaceae bacterium]